jgi:hypothetical protein
MLSDVASNQRMSTHEVEYTGCMCLKVVDYCDNLSGKLFVRTVANRPCSAGVLQES